MRGRNLAQNAASDRSGQRSGEDPADCHWVAGHTALLRTAARLKRSGQPPIPPRPILSLAASKCAWAPKPTATQRQSLM